ncbi:MAG: MBL fold metallo-hydrolase [bacterium]|nr:MBL fold metallo-hydrolase [bacterium]
MVIQKKQKIGFLIFLFLTTIVVWVFVFTQESGKFLKMEFFDVGQGDAEFIETPQRQQILIDGGPDMSVLEKLGRAMPFYDRYIDLVILTHPETDHLNGLIEVLKRYNVGAVITTGIIRDTQEYKEWIGLLEEKRIPVFIAKAGGIIDLGDNINVNIIYPFENLAGKKLSDTNNNSIVSQLVYGNFEALFTGDIEKSAENKLISAGVNLNSDILKIAHHGSKTSTSDAFLRAVNAILAVIEVGKDNSYGHPHQEVLERLKNLNILQTGKDGDIKIFSDGLSFEIKK